MQRKLDTERQSRNVYVVNLTIPPRFTSWQSTGIIAGYPVIRIQCTLLCRPYLDRDLDPGTWIPGTEVVVLGKMWVLV